MANFHVDIVEGTDTQALAELHSWAEGIAELLPKSLCTPENALVRVPSLEELTDFAKGNKLVRTRDNQDNIVFFIVAMINSGIYPPWDPDNQDGPWVKVQWGFVDPFEFGGMHSEKMYVEVNKLIGGKLWGYLGDAAEDIHDLIRDNNLIDTLGFQEPTPGYYTCLDLE